MGANFKHLELLRQAHAEIVVAGDLLPNGKSLYYKLMCLIGKIVNGYTSSSIPSAIRIRKL